MIKTHVSFFDDMLPLWSIDIPIGFEMNKDSFMFMSNRSKKTDLWLTRRYIFF